MNKRNKLLIIIFIITTVVLIGCTSNSQVKEDVNSNSMTLTDMLGRTVSIDGNAKKVVAIGPGALRLYCYIDSADKVVGIEQLEKDHPTGRPYALANESLKELDVIGPGGPNNSPDAEKILSVKPDVIFSMYAYDKSAVDELQSKTGIPVVALSYGEVSTFDPAVYESLEMIGKIMGREDRATEVIDFMKNCKEDLNVRTKDIVEDKKSSTYIGALSYKGSHGIESTYGNYSLFQAINANNVVDEVEKTGSIMIDKEKLIEWNPDKIFIDYGGLNLVKDDYNKNPDFYDTLTAFKTGELYSQLPYNFYHTNIGTAMADAYYLGKVLYPDSFSDIEPEKKADEIYKFLLGKEVYKKMAEDFGEFNKITID
ncbi:iron ABC transporter substrate-binding protein [Vallitalea longa]|uniref:Iron ABC transporter substrate-binding protein n=1 Tax=Vallitalea longa TaxID=2936439 RepID=A0A9W5YEG3_9FIRM|nr:iron ABC transporter substrate-binding protein [Vallitalea longa]GKX29713.1 iron ABC transporter substrate-binding protein [Vallitalea longa]